ncbi:MAG TPA: amidohydrolase family protein [Terriglobales bacterium]|nr:amidohydrolase family protein [Terriglobales bacterium]
MRRPLLILVLLFLPIVLAAQKKVRKPPPLLVLTNVNVVDVTSGSVEPRLNVFIRDGRIEAIAKRALIQASRNVQVVNADGKYLIPGLWDMHVHTAIRSEAESLLPLYLAYGVVGVRDMGGDFDRIRHMREEIAAGRVLGPTIVSPGPFVDGPQPEPDSNFLPVADAAEARAAVRDLEARGADFIKVQAGLSPEAYRAMADEAKRIGIAFAGHVPESVSAVEASDARQKSIEHLSPALPGDAAILLACSGREEELRRDLLALRAPDLKPEEARARTRALQADLVSSYSEAKCDRVVARLAHNRTVVVPTLIWSVSIRPASRADTIGELPMQYVPTKLRERWTTARRSFLESAPDETFALNQRMAEMAERLTGRLHRARVTLLAGTDNFDAFVIPGFSLHQELELLVRSGLSPADALRAATVHAARFLGRHNDTGTVAAGKRADLVVLDANPLEDIRNTRRISGVVVAGNYLRRADLDKMLADQEKAAAGAAGN